MNGNTIVQATDPTDAVRQITRERLANRNAWLYLEIHLPGKFPYVVKSFNTSIQILRCNGLRYRDGWDLTAKQFNQCLIDAFES